MTSKHDRFNPPRLPQDLATVNELATSLDIQYKGAKHLAAADIVSAWTGAPTTYQDARGRLRITRDGVDLLTSISPLGEHPKAMLTRVGPATAVAEVAEVGRTHKGYHGAMTPEEVALGLDRWWFIGDPDYWIGTHYVSAIAGFIVHAGRITGWHEENDKVALTVDATDPLAQQTWLRRRFKSERGRVLSHLTPNQLSHTP